VEDLNSVNQYVIKSRPIGAWIAAALLIGSSIFFLTVSSSMFLGTAILLGAGLLVLALTPVSTAVADRMTRTITITSRNLFSRKETVVPFNEVAKFDVQVTRTRSSRHQSSTNYRLVLEKTNGEIVPLQSIYTSFYDDKARHAKALSEFLNLPGAEDKPANLFQAGMQSQVQMTANPSQSQEGTTAGVTWKIEVHSVGGKPVTHWISADFVCPGNFLLVSQKPANSPSFGGGGLLGNLMTMVFQQVMGMYGFQPSDTPGFSTAAAITTQNTRFNQNFSALSNQQNFGMSLLNPWTIIPLVNWSDKYPLKTVSSNNQVGQLAVLYSPRGVQVALLGMQPATGTDELIALGVELVKAQGGGKPAA